MGGVALPVRLSALLLLGACAATAPLPTIDQPTLARLVAPYANDLRALGITHVVSPGNGAMVRLETFYGAVYVPYPKHVAPLTFMLDVDPEGVHGAASSFDQATYASALAAILPAAMNETASNNRIGWIRANPWR